MKLTPEGIGYIYRLKSDSFNRIDEWEWVSQSECEIVEKIPVNVKDFLHTVQFSPEAQQIQEKLFGNSLK